MTAKELNKIRNAINTITSRITWCENYATKELKMVFDIMNTLGLEWNCTEDKYHWIDGKPTTKSQVYRIEKNGEVLETVLIVDRYYGSDFSDNGHCELNCYLS